MILILLIIAIIYDGADIEMLDVTSLHKRVLEMIENCYSKVTNAAIKA
jgi:hypothetical protein